MRSLARARRGLGGRGVAALAVVAARATTCRTSTSARSSRRTRCTARGTTAAVARLFWARATLAQLVGARGLRALRRALGARVGGRADRHRDAARDARLRARLGGAAAVRGARALVAAPPRPRTAATCRRRSATGSRSAAQFVFLCLALAIVMGLARAADRRAGGGWPPRRSSSGSRSSSPSSRRSSSADSAVPRARTSRRLERIEHVRHVPRAGARRLRRAERGGDGSRPEPARRPLGPIVEPPFTPRVDRFVLAHELGHLAHNHIWKSIGWYALFAFPGAFLIALATRRRGGMGVPEAVPLSLFVLVVLQLARAAAPERRSRGTWRRRPTGRRCARRTTRPRGRRSSGCSSRRRSTSRTRRGGTTSCSRTTRRSCSASRWRRTGETYAAAQSP